MLDATHKIAIELRARVNHLCVEPLDPTVLAPALESCAREDGARPLAAFVEVHALPSDHKLLKAQYKAPVSKAACVAAVIETRTRLFTVSEYAESTHIDDAAELEGAAMFEAEPATCDKRRAALLRIADAARNNPAFNSKFFVRTMITRREHQVERQERADSGLAGVLSTGPNSDLQALLPTSLHNTRSVRVRDYLSQLLPESMLEVGVQPTSGAEVSSARHSIELTTEIREARARAQHANIVQDTSRRGGQRGRDVPRVLSAATLDNLGPLVRAVQMNDRQSPAPLEGPHVV